MKGFGDLQVASYLTLLEIPGRGIEPLGSRMTNGFTDHRNSILPTRRLRIYELNSSLRIKKANQIVKQRKRSETTCRIQFRKLPAPKRRCLLICFARFGSGRAAPAESIHLAIISETRFRGFLISYVIKIDESNIRI